MPIRNLYARQIFDTRGIPTVEVDLITELGLFRASVPAGVTSAPLLAEAIEFRDEDKNHYKGMSVYRAIENINNIIAPELTQADAEVTLQHKIDQILIDLDGTQNKSKLGANATFPVSIAIAKAGAAKRGLPLYRHIADLAGNCNLIMPVPFFNVVSGGVHAGNKIPFQEFMIVPTGASSFNEAMKIGSEVYQTLRGLLVKKFGEMGVTVTDEGAFGSNFKNANDALTFINNAIKAANYRGRVEIAINCAASQFFKKGKYDLNFKAKKSNPKTWLTPDKLMKQYVDFGKKFPIVSYEDPFNYEESWNMWNKMKNTLDVQIVGDALTVSNPERLKLAIDEEACTCVSLKVSQTGTLTEMIQTSMLAKQNNISTVVSHRTGDTEDTYLADIVVGLSAGQIKAGAPARSERMTKYNQLLRIEEELGAYTKYAGGAFRNP